MRRIVCALLCVALAGCTARAAVRHEPGTLVVLELGDAGSVNPLLTSQYYSFLYQNLIFDTLLGTGEDYKPVPELGTSWSSNRAGTDWIIHLRHGVRWSDGQPFDASDVVWTFEALTDPKTGSPYQGQDAFIKRVTALDPYTVRIQLSEPNATFVNVGLQSVWIMPKHVFAGIPHSQIRQTNFGEHPVGTGTYVLAHWDHDQEAVLTANPHWWGGTPSVRKIDFRIILQEQGRTDAMLDGAADIDDGIGADTALRLRGVAGLHQIDIPDLFTRFVQINFHTPGLNDRAVRQAMMYGWDREAVSRGLRHGFSTVASSIVPTALRYWHDDAVKPYPFDPARAGALLDGAGWRRGADGIRAKGRVRLAFAITLPYTPLGNDTAAAFQSDMRAIGIEISVRLLDYSTFIDQTNNSNYQLAFTGWGGSPDPDQFTLLDSKQIPPNGNNTGFYSNPAVDRDVEQGLKELDPGKRRAYYNDMQVQIARDLPALFLSNEFYQVAIGDRVHHTGPTLPGISYFVDVAHWRLDP
ncbi:MAG TPA: ABC transporter substrate-binding protein [Candidatus Elarobacter sp.]